MSLLRASERLREMEVRLTMAAEHVRFVADVNAQNDIRLRNSYAALNVEKLQLRCRGKHDTDEVAEAEADTDAARSEALLELRPEVESVLRLLFRHLDSDDTGTVSASLLLRVFGERNGEGEGEGEGEMKVVAGSGTVADSCNETYASVLASGLGNEGMQNLLTGLHSLVDTPGRDIKELLHSDISLTWGEFLLLLLPGAATELLTASRSGRPHSASCLLSHKDILALRKIGVFSDERWVGLSYIYHI